MGVYIDRCITRALRAHTRRAPCISALLCNVTWTIYDVDDLYLHVYMYEHMSRKHMHNAYWAWLMGLAMKVMQKTLFVTLINRDNRFEGC